MSRFANVGPGDRSGERFWWLSRHDIARGQTFGCFSHAEPFWIADRRAKLARRGMAYPKASAPHPSRSWARTRSARRRYLAAVVHHRARLAHLEARAAHRVGLDQRGELEVTRRGMDRAAAAIGMEKRGRLGSFADRNRRLHQVTPTPRIRRSRQSRATAADVRRRGASILAQHDEVQVCHQIEKPAARYSAIHRRLDDQTADHRVPPKTCSTRRRRLGQRTRSESPRRFALRMISTMSRFACLGPARSRAQQLAQIEQLRALSPRVHPLEWWIVRSRLFVFSRWDAMPRSCDGKTRARRYRFLDRVSGRVSGWRRSPPTS